MKTAEEWLEGVDATPWALNFVRMIQQDALQTVAAIADAYADENIRMAGDSVLHDPCLRGQGFTAANVMKSEKLQIEGCIHSAMFHAAQNISGAVRALFPIPITKEPATDA